MKLNTKKATDIKARLAAGATQRQVAEEFGISRSVVSDIATGRIWKDAPGKVPIKRAGGQSKPAVKYNPTDERVLELGAEINHLRDERSVLQRQVKAMSKNHGLFKAVAKEMDSFIKPFTALPPLPIARGHIKD